MALFPKPEEVDSLTKWSAFIRKVKPILDKLEWEEKKDFFRFMDQISLEYRTLDNLYIENRGHPRIDVRNKIEKQKEKITGYISTLNTQLMISKLYSI